MRFTDHPGSYPGLPGTFTNCDVEVDEAGNVVITPLALHPAEGPTAEVVAPPAEPVPPITQETIVPEQAAPTPAPSYPIGG